MFNIGKITNAVLTYAIINVKYGNLCSAMQGYETDEQYKPHRQGKHQRRR